MGQTATDTADGTVDYEGMEDFLTGKAAEAEGDEGDGESAADTGNEPVLVDVRIKGRTVKMTQEDAAAYESFVKEVRDRDGRVGGELSQLRERNARLEGQLEETRRAIKPAEELQPPPTSLAGENFDEYMAKWHQYTEAVRARDRAQLLDEIEQRDRARADESTNESAADQFVKGFYTRHAHLAESDDVKDVVQSAYQRNAKEINALRAQGRIEEAQDRLAELADAKLIALRPQSKQANANKPPRIEGAGTPPARTARQEPEPEFSAADWQREHRAKLRGESKK